MKRGVIVRADGGVSLFPWHSDEDALKTFDGWEKTARPEWLPATLESTDKDITNAEFKFHGSRTRTGPSGQPIDNALEWDGSDIMVNIMKARVVKTNWIRAERNARLDAIDKDINSKEDGGNASETTHLRSARQALRDLPATIQPDLAELDTPEVLEAYQPAWPE